MAFEKVSVTPQEQDPVDPWAQAWFAQPVSACLLACAHGHRPRFARATDLCRLRCADGGIRRRREQLRSAAFFAGSAGGCWTACPYPRAADASCTVRTSYVHVSCVPPYVTLLTRSTLSMCM